MKKLFPTYFCCLILFFCTTKSEAQQDSAKRIFEIKISYAAQFPEADMAETFGWNSNIGLGCDLKLKSNWIAGLKGGFMFGNQIKNDSIFHYFKTEDGSIIDDQGEENLVTKNERGFSVFAYGGRLFNVLAPNKNSGFLVTLGAGVLRHKIHFDWRDGKIEPLLHDMDKGYDRLSLGYAFNGFVGYAFLSKTRLLNFFAGFDYTLAFTKNMRGFNYDTRSYDTARHTDILYGFRVGWILPLYKRSPDKFYYN